MTDEKSAEELDNQIRQIAEQTLRRDIDEKAVNFRFNTASPVQ